MMTEILKLRGKASKKGEITGLGMKIAVTALMNAINLLLPGTEYYFSFLTNCEGEIPNCFWKLVAK